MNTKHENQTGAGATAAQLSEANRALGFATDQQAEDHANWLNENGSPEYKEWLESAKGGSAAIALKAGNRTRSILIDGTAYRIRYSYARGNGPLLHVLDIGGMEKGPAKGPFGDEFPDALVTAENLARQEAA